MERITMISFRISLVLVGSAFVLSACKTRNFLNSSFVNSITPVDLPRPQPNAKLVLNGDQMTFIASAMYDLLNAFYVSGDGYIQTPTGERVPAMSEIPRCENAGMGATTWSVLMARYYALLPTYQDDFFPNMRECFSMLVAPYANTMLVNGRKPTFPEATDYCLWMPIDREGGRADGKLINWSHGEDTNMPPFDDKMRSDEKNNAIGPFSWLLAHDQMPIFKLIMLGGKCGISRQSQQEILDKFMASVNASRIQLNVNFPTVPDDCP